MRTSDVEVIAEIRVVFRQIKAENPKERALGIFEGKFVPRIVPNASPNISVKVKSASELFDPKGQKENENE